mmetsp:Transcript_10907/g.5540  ORF Transcript_10907/g.5540 Transcript_10907/m.5540 type:complete len:89 (+) Transcript_10907:112-378(+)
MRGDISAAREFFSNVSGDLNKVNNSLLCVAEAKYREAMEIIRNVLFEDGTLTSENVNNLAVCAFYSNDIARAIDCIESLGKTSFDVTD